MDCLKRYGPVWIFHKCSKNPKFKKLREFTAVRAWLPRSFGVWDASLTCFASRAGQQARAQRVLRVLRVLRVACFAPSSPLLSSPLLSSPLLSSPLLSSPLLSSPLLSSPLLSSPLLSSPHITRPPFIPDHGKSADMSGAIFGLSGDRIVKAVLRGQESGHSVDRPLRDDPMVR